MKCFAIAHGVYGLKLVHATSESKAIDFWHQNTGDAWTVPLWTTKVKASEYAAARTLRRLGWIGTKDQFVKLISEG